MNQEQLNQTFSALADPTRRALLARLSQGESSVNELAEPFLKEMSLPAVTKHLKVLEKAGLVSRSREAQFRPCKLNGEALKLASDWMEQYRVFWEESFDRLDAYLKTVAPVAPKSTAAPKTSPTATRRKSNSKSKTKLKGKSRGRK